MSRNRERRPVHRFTRDRVCESPPPIFGPDRPSEVPDPWGPDGHHGDGHHGWDGDDDAGWDADDNGGGEQFI